MNTEYFEELVARAVQNLPDEFQNRLENIDVVVEDSPSTSQLRTANLSHGMMLLGLYEGIPRTRRGSGYGLVLPDKITIFRRSIEASCTNDDEIRTAIEKVVKHEIAHHFGISDARLEEIENGDG